MRCSKNIWVHGGVEGLGLAGGGWGSGEEEVEGLRGGGEGGGSRGGGCGEGEEVV